MDDTRICRHYPGVTLEHLETTPWYHYDSYIEGIREEAERAAGVPRDDDWITEDEYLTGQGTGSGLVSMGMSFDVVDLNEYRDAKAGNG